jgi:hypothetical protein
MYQEDYRPTQATAPTSASKWESDAVMGTDQPQSSTPYTPDGIDPQLAELLKSLEQPMPKPLTRTQQIGAGLMRLGQGLAGRDPSIQSGAEQDYARQAQAATESQLATKRGIIGEAVRQSGETRRDNAIAERQRLDDERAAKQKEADRTYSEGKLAEDRKYQDEKADREQRRKVALELIDKRKLKPGDMSDPANPPDWHTIIRASALPASPDTVAVESLRKIAQPGETSTISVPAGGEPTVQISRERSDKSAATNAPIDATSMATMLTNARATGEDFSDLVDDPKQKAILKRVADASMKKILQLAPADRTLLAPNLTGEALAERMITMMQGEDGSPNDVFGPGSLKLDLTQGEVRETFRKAAVNLSSAFLAARSGMAVSDAEYARLSAMLPDLNRIHLNNMTSLTEILGFFRANVAARTPGGKEDGVDALRRNIRSAQAKTFGLRPTDRVLPGVTLEDE